MGEIISDFLGGFNVITRVLIGEKQERERERKRVEI